MKTTSAPRADGERVVCVEISEAKFRSTIDAEKMMLQAKWDVCNALSIESGVPYDQIEFETHINPFTGGTVVSGRRKHMTLPSLSFSVDPYPAYPDKVECHCDNDVCTCRPVLTVLKGSGVPISWPLYPSTAVSVTTFRVCTCPKCGHSFRPED